MRVSSETKDFFEPRKEGAYVLYNPNVSGDVWISSDYRKRFALDARFGHSKFFDSDQDRLRININPRIRFSDRFNFIYDFTYTISNNRESFVSRQAREVIFGNRNIESVENSFRGSYNFNTKQALSINFRNFWSAATFGENSYSVLEEDGSLNPTPGYVPNNDPNANFNIWNLDLSYRWQFAPGSEAILLYRNSFFNLNSQSELDYLESLEDLLKEPLRQNISLRIVYFIDYNNVRNMLKS